MAFGLVSFRHVEGNEATEALASAINADPRLYVTPSLLGETRFIRLAVGQLHTTAQDTERLWAAIETAA